MACEGGCGPGCCEHSDAQVHVGSGAPRVYDSIEPRLGEGRVASVYGAFSALSLTQANGTITPLSLRPEFVPVFEGGGGMGGAGGSPPLVNGLGASMLSVVDGVFLMAEDKPYRLPNGDIFCGPGWNKAHGVKHIVPPKGPGGGGDLPPDKKQRWWNKLYEFTILTMTLTMNGKPLKDGDKEVGEVTVPDGVGEGPEPPGKQGGKGVYIKMAAVKKALKEKTGKDLEFNDMHNVKCKADKEKKPKKPEGSGGKKPTADEQMNYWVDNNAWNTANSNGNMGDYSW